MECRRCGQNGHRQQECRLMEVGQVVRVATESASTPDEEGRQELEVGAPPLPQFTPVGDFPLEQLRDDTLRSALDQVLHCLLSMVDLYGTIGICEGHCRVIDRSHLSCLRKQTTDRK
ncbi:hypothetical protein NHX12_008959 [Muraenolepis orangiensis]|uniref:CCHC-type domain-containing protein n=1 Tax=Muraenolepis orangiensis TaxID=630683 RepID=A0A9Q0I109_9TELE|nr:hypothetical protein NHX12_016575 [Muraenolepis orangiensis]KAJ3583717.1 hypothetical protein NHX12_015704 [Muraenolepis orangiensis]KAJ3591012.1 hypothetical protein NHX12_008959 [Muraenolepis orangiensis]